MFRYFGATSLSFSCLSLILKDTSCFSDLLLSFFPASVCVRVCVCVEEISSLCFSTQWWCWCQTGTICFHQWWDMLALNLKCNGDEGLHVKFTSAVSRLVSSATLHFASCVDFYPGVRWCRISWAEFAIK